MSCLPLLLLLCAACAGVSLGHGLEDDQQSGQGKKADDVCLGALTVLTQQATMTACKNQAESLKNQVDSLKNQVDFNKNQMDSSRNQMKDELSTYKAQMDSRLQAMQRKLEKVDAAKNSAKLESSVAFNVWHSTNPLNVAPGKTLIMDHVATNIGNGYDPFTGIFTVPVSGLYDFQATIMPYLVNKKKVYGAIYADNQLLAMGVADSGHNHWDQSTFRAVVHVTSGQRVYVKNISVAAAYYSEVGQPYTSFSGFLVRAD